MVAVAAPNGFNYVKGIPRSPARKVHFIFFGREFCLKVLEEFLEHSISHYHVVNTIIWVIHFLVYITLYFFMFVYIKPFIILIF